MRSPQGIDHWLRIYQEICICPHQAGQCERADPGLEYPCSKPSCRVSFCQDGRIESTHPDPTSLEFLHISLRMMCTGQLVDHRFTFSSIPEDEREAIKSRQRGELPQPDSLSPATYTPKISSAAASVHVVQPRPILTRVGFFVRRTSDQA